MNIIFQTINLSNLRQAPKRDWIVLCTLAGAAIIGLAVWNVWIFNTVAGGGTLNERAVETPPIVDQALLETVHRILETRAAEEAKYVSGTYHYTDPSQ